MSISGVGSAYSPSSSMGSGATSAKNASDAIIKEFMDYMKETPAQRMEDDWLRQHGISKADFNAMSAEEKQKVRLQMKQEIEQKIKNKATDAQKPGATAGLNILA